MRHFSAQYFEYATLTQSASNGEIQWLGIHDVGYSDVIFLPKTKNLFCLDHYPFLKLRIQVDSFPVVLGSAETKGARQLGVWFVRRTITLCNSDMDAMEVFGKTMVAVPTNVIYLSSILGQDGSNPVHKCDWKCENEHVCGNMFRCKLTGLTHICDKNCNQRILYDNNNSLCRVSRQVFPLTAAEVQAVKGVRRKLEEESSSPPDSCAFKRRRSGQFHPSPFERSFCAVGPICSQVGDGMDIN